MSNRSSIIEMSGDSYNAEGKSVKSWRAVSTTLSIVITPMLAAALVSASLVFAGRLIAEAILWAF